MVDSNAAESNPTALPRRPGVSAAGISLPRFWFIGFISNPIGQ
jgi:hypothetical protein